jgi:hypothetical protein
MWPSRDSTTNPFIGGSGSGNHNPFLNKNNSNNSNNGKTVNKNCFIRMDDEGPNNKEPNNKEPNNKEPNNKEEFPSLMLRVAVKAKAESAQTSYKDLLVSTIDHRMVEEQAKMRSAQAAELERGYKHYNKRAIAEARAAHAASASASAASTELELLYDEDGRERS